MLEGSSACSITGWRPSKASSCLFAEDVLGGLYKAIPACYWLFCMRVLRHIKRARGCGKTSQTLLQQQKGKPPIRRLPSSDPQVAPSYLQDRQRKPEVLSKNRHEQDIRMQLLQKSEKGILQLKVLMQSNQTHHNCA